MDEEIAAQAERELRVHQGRPRRAARHRRNLHAGAARLPATGRLEAGGRLAAVDVPDARRQAADGRHLLSAARPRRHAGLSTPCSTACVEAWTSRSREVAEDRRLAGRLRGREPAATADAAAAQARTTLVDARAAGCWRRSSTPPTAALDTIRPTRGRPSFPSRRTCVFLLDQRAARQQDRPTRCCSLTLEKISQGGIRDHVGGGFHRYSTDRFWRVPHFEKMLYDNGQLATVYALAYELTPRDDYRRVVDEMIEFVLREMTDERGVLLGHRRRDQRRGGPLLRLGRATKSKQALTPEEYAAVGRRVRTSPASRISKSATFRCLSAAAGRNGRRPQGLSEAAAQRPVAADPPEAARRAQTSASDR